MKNTITEVTLAARVAETQARFKRLPKQKGPDEGVGEFYLSIDITAHDEVLYIPLSVASGKKPAGFIYEIEGTAEGTISTADISVAGARVMQVTVGTILYAKIPQGVTATFRILVTMRGHIAREYSIVISRINFKLDPSDVRYKRDDCERRSKTLKLG